MKTSSRTSHVSLIWIVANLVSAGLFLALASLTWIEPELAVLPETRLSNVHALYPVVGATEGWRDSAFAAELARTTPTHG